MTRQTSKSVPRSQKWTTNLEMRAALCTTLARSKMNGEWTTGQLRGRSALRTTGRCDRSESTDFEMVCAALPREAVHDTQKDGERTLLARKLLGGARLSPEARQPVRVVDQQLVELFHVFSTCCLLCRHRFIRQLNSMVRLIGVSRCLRVHDLRELSDASIIKVKPAFELGLGLRRGGLLCAHIGQWPMKEKNDCSCAQNESPCLPRNGKKASLQRVAIQVPAIRYVDFLSLIENQFSRYNGRDLGQGLRYRYCGLEWVAKQETAGAHTAFGAPALSLPLNWPRISFGASALNHPQNCCITELSSHSAALVRI